MVFTDGIIPWNLGIFCWYAPVHGVFIVWKMVMQQNSQKIAECFYYSLWHGEICQFVDLYLVEIPKIQMYQSNTFAWVMLQGFFFPFGSTQILQKYNKVLIHLHKKNVTTYAYPFQCKLKNVTVICNFSFKTSQNFLSLVKWQRTWGERWPLMTECTYRGKVP